MQICLDHWKKMRDRVDALGLMQFVSATSEEAHRRMANDLQGKPDQNDFDPLMSMNFQFMGRILEKTGFRFMGERDPAADDGMPKNGTDYCPLCVVRLDFDQHNTPTGKCGEAGCDIKVEPGDKPWDDAWIDGCSEVIYKGFVERGQIKPS